MNSNVRMPLLGLLGIALGMGAFACSSSDDTTGTTTTPDGGVVATDSGATGDAGTGDAASPSAKVGTVTVGQAKVTVAASAVYVTSFAATFTDGPPVQQTPGTCVTTPYGACTFTECTTASTTDPGTAPAPLSAGDLKLTGGQLPADGLTLSPDKTGVYASKPGATQIFGGGETLTLKAAGATGGVPAFDGKTVVAPSDIVVTPALSTTSPTNVSRTTDYKFDWTGGGAGSVTLALATSKAGDKSQTILCTAAASAGTITVPQAAVAKLSATNAGFNGTIGATPTNTSSFTAGDVSTKLFVIGNPLAGSMTTN